jgi:hypothetical protein
MGLHAARHDLARTDADVQRLTMDAALPDVDTGLTRPAKWGHVLVAATDTYRPRICEGVMTVSPANPRDVRHDI